MTKTINNLASTGALDSRAETSRAPADQWRRVFYSSSSHTVINNNIIIVRVVGEEPRRLDI